MRSVTYQLGSIPAFCEEAEVALTRLSAAIADAERYGADLNTAYMNAVALYTKETTLSTRTLVAFGTACMNLTNELQAATDNLNNEIIAAGGVPSSAYRPDFKSDPQGWDALPSIAKVGIVVGSLGIVAWGLSSVASITSVFRPMRKR